MGEFPQEAQAFFNFVHPDASPTFRTEQGAPYFQMPELRDERHVVLEVGQRSVRTRLVLVVEEPRYGDGRVEHECTHQRWPSRRTARISSVDISIGRHWRRRLRKRITASFLWARSDPEPESDAQSSGHGG